MGNFSTGQRFKQGSLSTRQQGSASMIAPVIAGVLVLLCMFLTSDTAIAASEPVIVPGAASAPVTSAIAASSATQSPKIEQPQAEPFDTMENAAPVFLPLSPSERLELEELRVEARLRGLIDRQLIGSSTVRDRIEIEVDRAFERTTTLLNTLLALLVALPVLVAVAAWLLRRSITAQLVAEARSQLESEVLNELRQEQKSVVSTIEALQAEATTKLRALTEDAETLLGELKQQTDLAQSEIDTLKGDLALRMEAMVADAARLKERTMEELTQALPPSMQMSVPPERRSKLEELTSFLDRLRSAIPQLEFSVNDYIRQGNGLFFESRYQEALELYDQALELDPNAFDGWLSRAATLAMLRKDKAASAAYERSLQINPASFDAWFGLGGILQRLETFDQAIASYQKAAELEPTNPRPWAKQGALYLLLQNYEQALITYEQALELRPDQTDWLLQRAIAHTALDSPDQALEILQRVLDLDNTLPEAYFQRAIALSQKQDSTAARSALTKAMQLKPEYKERAEQQPELCQLLQ
ncbi:MAG: tetratricopeptide repeat protein [Cyanobacteria bacterium P01_C01_bin.89]